MKKYKWVLIALNLLLVLVFFNKSILDKEELLSDGQLILLELAPVDPRSLMQGDYMRLRYAITREQRSVALPKRGFCVVKLNELGIGEKIRFQESDEPLNDDEYLIEYTAGGWRMNIGAESYFFEEGQGEKYEKAKFGGIRVDRQGNSLLVGLYDKNRKLIN